MFDVRTLPAETSYYPETISDTPIFNALAAMIPPFCSSAASPARRSPTHRSPGSLTRSCVGGGRHRRSMPLADDATSTGRHHLLTPSYA